MSRLLFRSLHDLLPLGSLPIVARLPTKFLRMSRRLFRSLCDLLPLGGFSKVTKQLGRLWRVARLLVKLSPKLYGWFLTWASIFFRLLFNVVKGEGFYCIQYLAYLVPYIMSYNIISFQNGQAVTLSYRIRVQKISTCPRPRFSNPRETRWNIASMSALHKETLCWMLLYRYPQIMKISLLLLSNVIAGMWTSTRARVDEHVVFSV